MKILDWVDGVIFRSVQRYGSQPKESVAVYTDCEPAPDELMELAKKAIETAIENKKNTALKHIEEKVYVSRVFSKKQRDELGELIEKLRREQALNSAQTLFTAVICGATEEDIEDKKYATATQIAMQNQYLNQGVSGQNSALNFRPGQIIPTPYQK